MGTDIMREREKKVSSSLLNDLKEDDDGEVMKTKTISFSFHPFHSPAYTTLEVHPAPASARQPGNFIKCFVHLPVVLFTGHA
jgi:hypothetical protein